MSLASRSTISDTALSVSEGTSHKEVLSGINLAQSIIGVPLYRDTKCESNSPLTRSVCDELLEQRQRADMWIIRSIMELAQIRPNILEVLKDFSSFTKDERAACKARFKERFGRMLTINALFRYACTGHTLAPANGALMTAGKTIKVIDSKHKAVRIGAAPYELRALRNLIRERPLDAAANLIASVAARPGNSYRNAELLEKAFTLFPECKPCEIVSRYESTFSHSLPPFATLVENYPGEERSTIQSLSCGASVEWVPQILRRYLQALDKSWTKIGKNAWMDKAVELLESSIGKSWIANSTPRERSKLLERLTPLRSLPIAQMLVGLISGDKTLELGARLLAGLSLECFPQLLILLQTMDKDERELAQRSFQSLIGKPFLEYAREKLLANPLEGRFLNRRGDLFILNEVLEKGEASDAAVLYAAMEGFGTDESAIIGILTPLTKEEFTKLKIDYRRLVRNIHGPRSWLTRKLAPVIGNREKLREMIASEMSGSGKHEAEVLLAITERDHKAYVQVLKKLFAIEEKRWHLEKMLPWFAPAQLLKREVKVLRSHLSQLEWEVAQHQLCPSPISDRRCRELSRLSRRSLQTLRLFKHEVADFVAKVGAPAFLICAYLGIESFSSGPLPWYQMVAYAGVSLGVSMIGFIGLKWGLKGKAYGRDEMIHDAVVAFNDFFFRGMSRLFAGSALSILLKHSRSGWALGIKQVVQAALSRNDGRRRPLFAKKGREAVRNLEDIAPYSEA